MGKATWVVDPSHTLVEFSIRHMMISNVKGRFSKLEGKLVTDPLDFTTAEIAVEIDATSIDTREQQRDDHLRSADFLDVAQYPKLSFASGTIERKGEDEYVLKGDLTIHGVTRPSTWALTFEGTAKDPWGNTRLGLSAETKINRKDFGLAWNAVLETGGILVGEDVKISIHAEAIQQG